MRNLSVNEILYLSVFGLICFLCVPSRKEGLEVVKHNKSVSNVPPDYDYGPPYVWSDLFYSKAQTATTSEESFVRIETNGYGLDASLPEGRPLIYKWKPHIGGFKEWWLESVEYGIVNKMPYSGKYHWLFADHSDHYIKGIVFGGNIEVTGFQVYFGGTGKRTWTGSVERLQILAMYTLKYTPFLDDFPVNWSQSYEASHLTVPISSL